MHLFMCFVRWWIEYWNNTISMKEYLWVVTEVQLSKSILVSCEVSSQLSIHKHDKCPLTTNARCINVIKPKAQDKLNVWLGNIVNSLQIINFIWKQCPSSNIICASSWKDELVVIFNTLDFPKKINSFMQFYLHSIWKW